MCPTLLLFEVLGGDGPTSGLIWTILLILGFLGLIDAYIRWYLVLPIIPLLLVLSAFWVSEYRYSDLYPQVQREDPNFLPHLYAAIAVSFVLPIIGLILYVRRKLVGQ